MKDTKTKPSRLEVRVKELWYSNHSLAGIALRTGETIAQIAITINKLKKNILR